MIHSHSCTQETKGDANAADILPNPEDNGKTLSKIPENEFIQRATKNGKLSVVRAHKLYSQLWAMVADARTRQRKQLLKVRKGESANDRVDAWAKEMLERIAEEESHSQ